MANNIKTIFIEWSEGRVASVVGMHSACCDCLGQWPGLQCSWLRDWWEANNRYSNINNISNINTQRLDTLMIWTSQSTNIQGTRPCIVYSDNRRSSNWDPEKHLQKQQKWLLGGRTEMLMTQYCLWLHNTMHVLSVDTALWEKTRGYRDKHCEIFVWHL